MHPSLVVMKYTRFEDLPVWQAAIELALRVFDVTKRPEFRGPGDLADQLRRAALSISNNIAEGFERGTTSELLAFLYIARGSAGEVRSMLRFCERAPWIADAPSVAQKGQGGGTATERRDTRHAGSDLRSQISNLKSEIPSRERSVPGGESQISNLKSEISKLIALAESCSRQLRAWADRLQNSDIAGQRHLTDKSRKLYHSKQQADAFWKNCEEVVRRRLVETRSHLESGADDFGARLDAGP